MWALLLLLACASSPGAGAASRVLVVGGSGRVGGSAVRALVKRDVRVDVAGRSAENWQSYLQRARGVDADFAARSGQVGFRQFDFTDAMQRASVLPGYDLVVNTAGPFQGLSSPDLLEACLTLGIQYVDVCDDIALSRVARSTKFQVLAKEHKASAIISAGIWPGISSLLAQSLIERVVTEEGETPKSVKFNFFTAGSGGAGETILTATFLLLGEDVLVYNDGEPTYLKTATDALTRDFGPFPGLGPRSVARLNLIECESCFKNQKSKFPNLSVETRFGTAPAFWNSLFQAMAQLVPQSVLRDRAAMRVLALVSLPAVRLVDSFVGSANGIQVEVQTTSGSTHSALLSHADLEDEVGQCLADFAVALLSHDSGQAGIWFPEEIPSSPARQSILQKSCARALVFRQ